MKYADYQQVTRSRTLLVSIRDQSIILQVAQELLDLTEVEHKAVRLLGLTVSNLTGEKQEQYVQLCLPAQYHLFKLLALVVFVLPLTPGL